MTEAQQPQQPLGIPGELDPGPMPDTAPTPAPEVHGGHIEQPPVADDRPSSREVVDSLTGYDEVAIEKRFGRDIEDLAENTGTTFLRALMFTLKRREGLSDGDAHTAVMSMTFAELREAFAPDADADLPGSPVGEGNG